MNGQYVEIPTVGPFLHPGLEGHRPSRRFRDHRRRNVGVVGDLDADDD